MAGGGAAPLLPQNSQSLNFTWIYKDVLSQSKGIYRGPVLYQAPWKCWGSCKRHETKFQLSFLSLRWLYVPPYIPVLRAEDVTEELARKGPPPARRERRHVEELSGCRRPEWGRVSQSSKVSQGSTWQPDRKTYKSGWGQTLRTAASGLSFSKHLGSWGLHFWYHVS